MPFWQNEDDPTTLRHREEPTTMATGPLPTIAEFDAMMDGRRPASEDPREEGAEVRQQQPQEPTPDMGQELPPETKLLQYQKIVLCQNCGQHGKVHFGNTETGEQTSSQEVAYPDDLEYVYQLLDKESVQRLQNDVVMFQAEGKLMYLASPEVREQLRAQQQEEAEWARRQAEQARKLRRQQLADRAKQLDEKAIRLEVAALSNQRLVGIVTDRLMEALDKPELKPVFSEMFEREFVIKISVEDSCGCQKVVDLTINPQDLISQEINNDTAEELEAERKKFLKDILDMELDSY